MFLGRLWVLTWCLFCAVSASSGDDIEETNLKVMSFNIRLGSAKDGENAWPYRRELVVETIRAFGPDFLGLQEAERMQLDKLVEALPEYVALGVGRAADGGGEYSSILYRWSRFDISHVGTFWLSDTPSVPGSKSWGNGPPRICTWIRVFDRATNRRFYVFNTHWDHRSQPSRERGAQLMVDRIAEREAPTEPFIVMGDFNAGEENSARLALAEAGLRDAFRVLHPRAPGNGTFNGFKGRTDGGKIDAVLISQHWIPLEASIDRTERDGRFPSDHFPVTAALSLKRVAE